MTVEPGWAGPKSRRQTTEESAWHSWTGAEAAVHRQNFFFFRKTPVKGRSTD